MIEISDTHIGMLLEGESLLRRLMQQITKGAYEPSQIKDNLKNADQETRKVLGDLVMAQLAVTSRVLASLTPDQKQAAMLAYKKMKADKNAL